MTNTFDVARTNIGWISDWVGECAYDYPTQYDYVIKGGWEKDYFDGWLNNATIYPTLEEIIDFCNWLNEQIELWISAVEEGVIDSEASREEE